MPAFQSSREISGSVTPTTNDDGGVLTVTSTATVTLTASGWTVGRSAMGFEVAAGTLTFVGAGGVTVRNVAGDLVKGEQYTSCVARYSATNTWTIFGTEPPQLPDGSVTLAKHANVTGPTGLGRVTGTGPPQELTPAQIRAASQTAGPVFDITHPAYGAVPGGNATAAINAAIAAASPGDIVHIPTGEWWITVGNGSTSGGIMMNKAGVHLRLAEGAEVKAEPTSAGSYHIVLVTAADCVISGGKFIGDVPAHTGVTGEWGHGIIVGTGGSRTTIRDTEVTLCWGDGFNLTGASLFDVRLENVRFMDNRRGGCAISRAERVMVDFCTFGNNGQTAYVSPGFGIDWEPNETQVVTGQMSNCVSYNNAGPGVAIGTPYSDSTVRVRVDGYRSYNDNTLGASGLGETSLYLSSYCDVDISNATIIGGRRGVSMTTTTKAKLTDVVSQGATVRGFYVTGTVDMLGCTSRASVGTGFYVDTTAANVTLVGCVAEGAGSSATGQGFDLYGAGMTLVGCLTRSPGASMARSYVVRTGATDVRMLNCVSVTAGTSGHFIDQTSAAFVFPVPGVTKPTYAATNVTTDRAFDANATTLDEVADVVGTLIADLRAYGLVQ